MSNPTINVDSSMVFCLCCTPCLREVDGLDDDDDDKVDAAQDLVSTSARIRARSIFALERCLNLIVNDPDVEIVSMRATLDPVCMLQATMCLENYVALKARAKLICSYF